MKGKLIIPKPLASVVLATASGAGTHGTQGKVRDRRKGRRVARQALRSERSHA